LGSVLAVLVPAVLVLAVLGSVLAVTLSRIHIRTYTLLVSLVSG
jgi:hypothetical protein